MLTDILLVLIPINLLILTIAVERLKHRVSLLEQPAEQPKHPCFYKQPENQVVGYQPPTEAPSGLKETL